MNTEAFRKKYGPWAVVTGASDGIGKQFAIQLAEGGMNLVLAARRRQLLDSLAAELAGRCSIETRVVAGDLAQQSHIDHLDSATRDLDIGLLVAAAGFGASGPFIRSELASELAMADVNCRALMAMSYLFGQRFARQKRGGMILMSSLVAFQGVPHAAHYAATKAYVQSLAEGLHEELKPHGVDVLACAPGPVHSGFASRADMRMGMALQPADIAQATLNGLGRHRTTVRPGWLSKALEFALATLPRQGRVRMMGVVMGGMIKHQHVHQTKIQTRGSS